MSTFDQKSPKEQEEIIERLINLLDLLLADGHITRQEYEELTDFVEFHRG